MNLDELIDELTAAKKQLEAILRSLKEIAKVDKDREGKLPRLKALVTKLEQTVTPTTERLTPHGLVNNWITAYRKELDQTAETQHRRLGIQLEELLQAQGLKLQGQYPLLRVGLFAIEIDFEHQQTTLWLGAQQEQLGRCSLSAAEITKKIQEERQHLGSGLEPSEFAEKLRLACARAASATGNSEVPIITALSEMAHLLQKAEFVQNPIRDNYHSYRRADFAYDLYRSREALRQRQLSLVVAVRAKTQRRQDFLWVPDNDAGDGTTFSYIQTKQG